MSTLYRGGFVYSPVDPFANAMVVDGDTIAWIGGDYAARVHESGVDEVVESTGRWSLRPSSTPMPTCHRPVPPCEGSTSPRLPRWRSPCRGSRTPRAPTRAVRSTPRTGTSGTGPRPAPPRRPSSIARPTAAWSTCPASTATPPSISSALAAASGARQQPGWRGDGLVTRDAHHVAREAFNAAITPAQRRSDIDLALRTAAAAGIGLVHENGGRILSSADDFADVLAAGERGDGPQTLGYWAQLVSDEQEAREAVRLVGAHGLAGDLNVDGSVGSRTASLREPYTDAEGHRGNGYLSVEQVRDHIAACSLAGLQGGFHVIGDAGVDTVIAGFEAAAEAVGAAAVRRARHRLEHLEMIEADGIARLVALGVTASVQPAFDAHWGGGEGMYAARLGRERATAMNPFASMLAAGMTLALGISKLPSRRSTPGRPCGPPCSTTSEDQRLARSACSPTPGGLAGRRFRRPRVLRPRAARHVRGLAGRRPRRPSARRPHPDWSTDPRSGAPGLPDLSPGAPTPTTLRTVVRGRTIFDTGALA